MIWPVLVAVGICVAAEYADARYVWLLVCAILLIGGAIHLLERDRDGGDF